MMRFWISDFFEFVGRHWGDFVGLLLLYTGVVVVLWGPQQGTHIGESLVLAAMGVLKLKGTPKNGNGGTNGHTAT